MLLPERKKDIVHINSCKNMFDINRSVQLQNWARNLKRGHTIQVAKTKALISCALLHS